MRWMKCWTRSVRQDSLVRVLLVALLAADGAPAQDTPAQDTQAQDTIHTQSNVVIVPALVKNAKGEAVYGLGAKDFVVEDDGVEQPVRLDEAAEGSAMSLVIAIQRGRRANYEFPRIRGLSAMVDPMLEAGLGSVAIVEFDSQAELMQDFSSNSEKTA